MQIKMLAGKLTLRAPLGDIIHEQQQANQIALLPITLPHVLDLENLPAHHRDPSDRLLIAQARIESAILISRDAAFAQYPVQVVW